MTASNLNARIEEILSLVWKHAQSRRSSNTIAKFTKQINDLMVSYAQACVKESLMNYRGVSALAPEMAPRDGTVIDLWMDKANWRAPQRYRDCHYENGQWLAPTGAGGHYILDGEIVGWYPVVKLASSLQVQKEPQRPTPPPTQKMWIGVDLPFANLFRRMRGKPTRD